MKRKLVWISTAALLILAGTGLAQQQRHKAMQSWTEEVRRVVTVLDASGKAIVMSDSVIPLAVVRPPNPAANMWVTDKTPPDFSATDRAATIKTGLMPPANGTVFRIVDFVPTPPAVAKMDMNTMMKVVGAGAPAKGLPPRHPMMHRTRTLDYAIIMSGEIDMLLDDQEVHLRAGNVVVQQATNHAWVNRGKEVCRVAFILMESQEP
jgi:mannose-6-phosphate isomerase-like protein (cupin superfamily)